MSWTKEYTAKYMKEYRINNIETLNNKASNRSKKNPEKSKKQKRESYYRKVEAKQLLTLNEKRLLNN